MAAMFNFVFVFLALFPVAFAWPAVETTNEETKTIEAVHKPLVLPLEIARKAAGLDAIPEEKTEEQIRQKRGCKKIGFTSRSGRKIEAGHGC